MGRGFGNRSDVGGDGRPVLRIGHSPDPDDAFMWFPLTGIGGGDALIDTGRFRYVSVQEDISKLNRRAEESGDLEITAISIAQYPYVCDRYILTNCGSSMGDGYGPKIVARAGVEVGENKVVEFLRREEVRVAVPGLRTSARLATALMVGRSEFGDVAVPFDEIMERTAGGEFDAGVVIHEGQLTFESAGLLLLTDLGKWWGDRTGMLLPLGGNVIRRDLEDRFGRGSLEEVTGVLLASIRYALEHRSDAIDYAMKFGRGLDRELADRFVAMYVNKQTLDYGSRGRESVARFLIEAADAGLVPRLWVGGVDLVEAAGD